MSLSKHCQCDLEATANHHKTPIKPSEKSIKHMWFTVLPMHLRIGTQLLASSTKVSPEQDFTAQCPWRCSYHTVTQWTQTWGHGCLICHTRLDCKMAGFKALHDLKTNCTHSASTVSGKAKEWESHLVVSRGICVQNTYLHPQCGAQPTFVVVPHPSYCIKKY